ncbi:stomatin-like protein 2, mitochondrial isoform X2 [Parambassis ranga]|uniref:Stomatin-like protein 2, mitochondrial isoform X2 n=1 Tax=Parambassis ranga TaxID=210632 RepID=A0A6P7HKR8_9TELE|nr:stomatin-like protein 2, mitochondrial isoform X2 [Parambassis ranga]
MLVSGRSEYAWLLIKDLSSTHINKASDKWGIRCNQVTPRVKELIQMQVEAECRQRATALEFKGTQAADINIALWPKILGSEGNDHLQHAIQAQAQM